MKRIIPCLLALYLIACNNSTASGPEGDTNGKLYLRTYMWTGMYGSSLDISWIYFGNDGTIVRNPVHGANPVQFSKEKAGNTKNTGTWKEEGDKILISWSDGRADEWSMEKKSGEYSILDGGIATRQEALPADYKLEGQYAALSVLPNVSNSQTLVFRKDGSFSMNNTGTVTTADVSGVAAGDRSGNYTITGNTLTLKFNDGEEKKSVITIWDMDGEKNLVINTRYFPQEK